MERINMRQSTPSETATKQTVDDVLRDLDTDMNLGLSMNTAIDRAKVYGLNEFQVHEEDPLWVKYLSHFKDPLILLLMASATVSLLVKQWDDAISICLAVIIVVTVGFVQEHRSEQSIQQLTRLVPYRCHCVRDGQPLDMLAKDLVPGDVVVVRVGDRVPADIRLVQANELAVDESMLTGETHDRLKQTEALMAKDKEEIAISERCNMCFMGTLVRNGHGRGVVVATGESSEFGAIFHMMQEGESKRTPLQLRMDELGQKLSYMSFGVIAIIIIVGIIQHKSLLDMFTIGVSLAVAAIPEGLPIVVTVTLALGVMRMASKNAIVKKLPAVEALGSANVICADKTGTLTQNEMTLTHLYVHGERRVVEVTGKGYVPTGTFSSNGMAINPSDSPAIGKLLEVGVLCNNSYVANEQVMGQATEGALLVAAAKFGIPDLRGMYERISEIPFSSDTKWMAVKAIGQGETSAQFYVKGMVEAVLDRCTTYYQTSQSANPTLTEADREEILEERRRLASQGLRILALGWGKDINNLCFVGLVALMDPPRDGVDSAIFTLRNSGVHVAMITGDGKDTALAIGRMVGLYVDGQHQYLSGQQLETMSTSQLASVVEQTTVFYQTSPRHKLSIVSAYQAKGLVVAMTGDGVNDAPALKQADIGISMGKTGTDVSKEAADMILVNDDFTTILSAINEGKGIFCNIKNFVCFQLSTSLAALGLVGLVNLLGYPNPLNAMQILWVNIIMDGPPAQSLGVEPVDPDVMRKPPRKADSPIITRALAERMVISAAIIIIGTTLVFLHQVTDGVVTRRDTTMSFTAFVFFDMFNALACRSADKSIFSIGFTSNHVFLWAVAGSVLGQLLVIYTSPLQHVFQTEALSLSDLAALLCIASSVFWVDELRKRKGRTKGW